LGVSEVIFLGYRDSGMAGTAANSHPDAFINAPAHEVVAQLVGIIRREQPQVLLTFEPYGGYGHPDHVAVNRHTVAAFHAAGKAGTFRKQGEPWRPSRLFYPLLPASLIREMKERVAAAGGDISGYDEMIEERAKHDEAWPDHAIHAVLDVSAYVDQKWEAWNCHQTQFGPNSRFRRLPAAAMKELLSTEYFGLAYPAASPSIHLTDLFQGLH
jgi:LmbE family N-acetylglucosaminyl deacetylase